MSMCLKAVSGAYEDDKRETLNSLLRVKTPFPKRDHYEEISVKTASCACIPLKCLEGIAMITCGAILWPIPCTVCHMRTEHENGEVSVKRIYPGCRTPNIPCHFKDTYDLGTKERITEGKRISCVFGERPKEEEQHIDVTSSVTGYNCLSSGVGKIVNTLISTVCCPITSVSLAFCNEPI